MILILLVLCEFLIILKVFRCSGKFRISSLDFFGNLAVATHSGACSRYIHVVIVAYITRPGILEIGGGPPPKAPASVILGRRMRPFRGGGGESPVKPQLGYGGLSGVRMLSDVRGQPMMPERSCTR